MSLGKIYTVWCDVNKPGCHNWVAQEPTSQGARKVARQAGWERLGADSRGRVMDACPACKGEARLARS